MNTMTQTLSQPLNLNSLENQVRGAMNHGSDSLDTWMHSAWNKVLLTLATAFPVPGDGMH